MKLIKKSLNRDESGVLTLCPEDSEDMWYIYNLIQINDEIQARTVRKVVPLGANGTPLGPGVRKQLVLQVRVEKIDYDVQGQILRLNGIVTKDTTDVSAGSHHTLQLEINRNFDLYKDTWDSYALQTVDEATNIENHTDIAAAVFQPGLAHICLVKDAMTIVRAKIELTIPRKRRGDNSAHEKALNKFLELMYKAIQSNINLDKVKVVLLAAPGTLAQSFHSFMFQKAVQEDNKALIKSKSKFLVVHASSGHLHALNEALKSPQVQSQLQTTRFGREIAVLDRFLKHLNDDDGRAWYGVRHIEAAAEQGAIQTLMLTDTLFRSVDIMERRRYIALTEAVKALGREVLIFSSLHPSGEQLDHLTGVACILQYALPELEDIKSSTEEDD